MTNFSRGIDMLALLILLAACGGTPASPGLNANPATTPAMTLVAAPWLAESMEYTKPDFTELRFVTWFLDENRYTLQSNKSAAVDGSATASIIYLCPRQS